MSTQANNTDATLADVLGQYAPGTGEDRYVRFIQDVLDYEVTDVIREIAVALNEHEQVLAIGANGPGKSFGASLLAVAVLYTNADTVVPISAGNGDTLKNSIWKNILSVWKDSGLPGSFNKSDRSVHTPWDPKWFLECHSPRYPDDLEGDHNNNVVYIIEEADKQGLTSEHIDSARSTLGDDDHILVIANPPTDETNVVADLMQNPEWHRLQFPTWESRNAKVDRGVCDKEKIGGIAGLSKMQSDWAEYHDSSWPGIERVIEVSSPYLTPEGEPTTREWEAARKEQPNTRVGRDGLYDESITPQPNPEFRDDLHTKWYKRRAGVMPTGSAQKWRPWSLGDVEAAYNRTATNTRETPTSVGVDVAESVDDTVAVGKHLQRLDVEYTTEGEQVPYPEQEQQLREKAQQWPDVRFIVDAVGEGSGLQSYLDRDFETVDYSAGTKARKEGEYRNKWAESLYHFGKFLRNGGSINDEHLYKQAKVAARILQFQKVTLQSRNGDVIEATKKEKLKQELGRSPDYLDAALQAVWDAETEQDEKKTISMGW